jgi:tetratricopeptide (TPR) repeat protein
MTPNAANEGQVVTFYSYKGGTGRTMALANVAWILASNGLRVLTVDWDLESPGLHKFFHPFLDESTIAATSGVINILSDYTWAVSSPKPRPPDWHLDFARVLPHAVSLKWANFPEPGTLDFISAGRQNRDYSSALTRFNWDHFYDRQGGGIFIEALRADMKRNYDYTLIDSRTGLSDIADICTIELPDILVDCFTLNDQNIEGASTVARQINERYHERSIEILPVPMRIDEGEKDKLDIGRSLARAKFEPLPTGRSAAKMAQYWGSVEIPYIPYYAYEEILATFGDEPESPTSLLAAFVRLTSAITNDRVTSMPPLADEMKLRYKYAFTRRPPSAPSDVFLSYAPEDRMWADWIKRRLELARFRVLSHSTASTEGSSDGDSDSDLALASHIVVVLSTGYVRSFGARAAWMALSAAAQSGAHGQLIPIRIDDTPLTSPFSDHSPVEIASMDEEAAVVTLMRALGRSAQLYQSSAPPESGPRFPGAVPAIWNVSARNASFTGRSAILEKLRDQLLAGGPAIVLAQALYGLGGVGKTQVALEYAHRFMADYDLIWWIPAASSDQIAASLAELAVRMGIQVGENIVEAARSSLEALRRNDTGRRWLLIFDNGDEPKELQPYLPSGHGHVLITSRNQAWSQLAEPLEVDVFSREESIAHLRLHVPELDRNDADRVAHELGDLPLAVEQAGAWLRETAMPAATYVEQLQTQVTSILSQGQPLNYPASAVATWNMSLTRLQKSSPAAVRLLQLCSFFSAEPISMNLLYSDEMISSLLPFDRMLVDRIILGRVIKEISRFALVKVDQGSNSIQIHRLVQAVIRSQMSHDERADGRHEVHKILLGARPQRGDTDDPENWSAYGLIWPHLMPSRAATCEDEGVRELLIDHVRYLWLRSEFDVGFELSYELLDLWKRQLGADHRQTLYLRFHIANLLRSRGSYSEALEVDEDVLAKQRELLPPDHPHTLMTAGGLAADLRALGQFQQALAADEDTYNRLKDQFGEEHPRTLAMANNLAVSLRLVGDCFTAGRIDRETYDRRRLVLGPDKPFTLYSAANLARDMREAGEYRASVDLLRTTYEKYRLVLGDDQAATLRTAKSLAVSLRKAGAHSDAKRLTEGTYQRYVLHYGRDFPDALACALNLACDYSAVEDKVRARDLAVDVRSAYESSLGADHPYTLIAANNLVTYLRGVGSFDEAIVLTERTLQAMRERLGPDHPYTLSCAVNTANCLADIGRLDEAEAQLRETAPLLTEKLRPRHPDTLVCQANLTVVLREAGKPGEAESLREMLLDNLVQVLGEHHPDTTRLRDWRRSNRDLEPQPT